MVMIVLVSLTLSRYFSLTPKKSNQKKGAAAPASFKVSAFTSVVLPEPIDAGFLRLTEGCAFSILYGIKQQSRQMHRYEIATSFLLAMTINAKS